MKPVTTEFSTDTRRLKKSLTVITGIMIGVIFVAGLVGGVSWSRAALYALLIPGVVGTVLWTWATLCAFDRVYTVSGDGVGVSKRGRILENIAWKDIARVATGNLRVIASDGRRIAFNLPPPVQREAHELIKAWREHAD
jgi:hypothetical protein